MVQVTIESITWAFCPFTTFSGCVESCLRHWKAAVEWSSCPNLNRKVFLEQLPKLRYFYLYLTEWTFVQFSIEFQPTVLYVAPQLVGFLAVFPGLNMEIFRRTRVLFCGGASMSKGPALMLLERFKGYPLELREGKIF
jgi:hypothetical protein